MLVVLLLDEAEAALELGHLLGVRDRGTAASGRAIHIMTMVTMAIGAPTRTQSM